MVVYWVLLAFIFCLFLRSRKYDKQSMFILFVVIGFLGFFRANTVGTDVVLYSKNFFTTTARETTWSPFTEFEPGFNYLIIFFKEYISHDPLIFLGFVFLIYLYGVFYLIYKTSVHPVLSIFFLLTLNYVTSPFNIMRQFMAIGLACFLLLLILEKSSKTWTRDLIIYCLGIVIIATLFHRSLIVLLVLPIFYSKPGQFWLTKPIILTLLAVSYVVFLNTQLIGSLASKITFLNARYTSHLSVVTEKETSPFTSFLETAFCAFVVIVSPNVKNIYIYAYVIGIFLMNFFGALNPVFLRIAISLVILKVVYFAYLWYYIPNNHVRRLFRVFSLLYGVTYFANVLIKNYGDVVPYINRLIE